MVVDAADRCGTGFSSRRTSRVDSVETKGPVTPFYYCLFVRIVEDQSAKPEERDTSDPEPLKRGFDR